MGKISSEPQTADTTTATHFSHPHPLKLINTYPQVVSLITSTCAGCKLNPSGMIYTCTTCNYFLHKQCFDMPRKISHPFHKEHTFALLPEPAYDGGLFNCDACGETGQGFSYHCKPCGIDLHILCAVMPLSVASASHSHKLDLAFKSPYDTKNFCCDICRTNGKDHWLYRCASCGFDAHLNCAKSAPPQQQPHPNFTGLPPPQQQPHPNFTGFPPPQQQPRPNFAGFPSHAPPQQQLYPNLTGFPFHSPLQQPAAAIHRNFPAPPHAHPPMGVPAGGPLIDPLFTVNRQNEMLIQSIQQMISNNTAMAQAMLAAGNGGGIGGGLGGGFGGNGALQQMVMQLMNNNGGGGLLGGGGGGVDALQSLLGGGNGLDLLGGGNGLDLLGGLLGGFGF